MKEFEIVVHNGTTYEHFRVSDHQIDLYCRIFDVESLDGLFDVARADEAVPVLDAAIARINSGNPEIKAAVAADDRLGMWGKRRVLEAMRRTLVDSTDAVLSGLVEVDK